jgi:hypothetical protein
MLVTFTGLTVSVEAPTAKEAYTQLSNLLAGNEFTTDQYYTDENYDEKPTDELFPTDDEIERDAG